MATLKFIHICLTNRNLMHCPLKLHPFSHLILQLNLPLYLYGEKIKRLRHYRMQEVCEMTYCDAIHFHHKLLVALHVFINGFRNETTHFFKNLKKSLVFRLVYVNTRRKT